VVTSQEVATVTKIRANCPSCGEVDLTPPDVTLRIVRSEDGLVGDGSSYRFHCPDCEQMVTKPADERIAQLLTTGGVPVETGEATDDEAALIEALKPLHPERPAPGPRLTPDDLLDLHFLLETDDWFEQLLQSTH
jgi:predicted RNA-binding Zn-ribbon protein involved in translation (DUF1610 family)